MNTRFFGDTAVLLGRSLRHIGRSPDTIVTTAITPIAMMLMFVYVFGGAIDTGSHESYVSYQLPGILLIRSPPASPTPPTVSSRTRTAACSTGSSRCRSLGPRCCGVTC